MTRSYKKLKLKKSKKRRKNKTAGAHNGDSSSFTQEDYCSPDGMLTQVWGPSMWHFLHTMSFNYPVNPSSKDKENYKRFLNSMKHVLPCGHCRSNLNKNYRSNPITNETMRSRDSLSRFIYSLHERINKQLDKKSGLTFEAVRDRYENFRSRCSVDKSKSEKGCVKSAHGKKSRCLIRIVPHTRKCPTMLVDKKCTRKTKSRTG